MKIWHLVTVAVGLVPATLCAQDRNPAPVRTSTLLIANALIGGVTAGVGNAMGGRPFLPAFAKGSAGGLAVYAGKRIIAEEGPLASWTGRQLAAVGSSGVRNAAIGRPVLSELIFPIGPARVYLKTTGRPHATARLDLSTVLGIVMVSARTRASFDLPASVAYGAIIFTEPWDADSVGGALRSGVIRVDAVPRWVPRDGENMVRSGVTAHELIHAVQYDFVGIAMSEPLESWALNKTKVGRSLDRYVDLGILTHFWSGTNAFLDRNQRPWEREAYVLASGK